MLKTSLLAFALCGAVAAGPCMAHAKLQSSSPADNAHLAEAPKTLTLKFSEAANRIERLYRPYHRALNQLLNTARNRFGFTILLDCHSMPSSIGDRERGLRQRRADIVLGDCHGTSCHPIITETAQRRLTDKGYAVALNAPYAGGYTTVHYGRPAEGSHCLQIEINRSLYMDERSFARKPFLARLVEDMREVAGDLAAIEPGLLKPS